MTSYSNVLSISSILLTGTKAPGDNRENSAKSLKPSLRDSLRVVHLTNTKRHGHASFINSNHVDCTTEY